MSPTSSLKKQRAEQILKQHGSPPGLRVTAGGRIVTSDQSPLCSPRYGYSAINKNGGLIRFAPGYPPPPHTFANFSKSLPNGFVAQDPDGKLCQMVDGHFIPINEVNGVPQLAITAPNLTSIPPDKAPKRIDRSTQSTSSIAAPPIAVQVAALEKQYQKLESERRGLDKAEVLQRGAMTNKGYNQLIQKRRELVRHQDEIRRDIKTLRDVERSSDESRQSFDMMPPVFPGWSLDGVGMPPAYWPPTDMYHPAQGYDYGYPMPFAPMQASLQHFMPGLPEAPAEAAPGHQSGVKVNGPAEGHRRSVLNPKSAVYEPPFSNAHDKTADGTLAEAVRAHNAWAGPEAPRQRSQSSSEASFTTADFFPRQIQNQRSRPGKTSSQSQTKVKSTTRQVDKPDEAAKVTLPDRSQNVSPKTRRAASDTTTALTDYDEGFKSGLAFNPIDPTKSRGFLDGYCAGVKQAADNKPSQETRSSEQASSPNGSIAHRMERRAALDGNIQRDMHDLKQAVFAANNENAVLSPVSADLSNVGQNLDQNAEAHDKENKPSDNVDTADKTNVFGPAWRGNRIDGFHHMPNRPHRILSSPIMEWKGHSIAEGLTTGVLGQMDGTERDMLSQMSPLVRTPAMNPGIKSAGASPSLEPKTPRFRAEPGSPTNSPLSLSGKKISPAKAKLAQMATRASNKVFGPKDESPSMSPQDRKWRNMWKKKHTDVV